MADWHEQLQAARKRAGISRDALAACADLSVESIRSYEIGRRHPSRDYLVKLLTCMHADELSRNHILVGAGYASDAPVPRLREPNIPTREAVRIVRARTLPTFLLDVRLEIVAMNDTARLLIGLPDAEGARAPRRSLLTFTTRRAIATRAVNWEELIATVISSFKAAVPEEPSVETPGPYLSQLLQEICGGDPLLVKRFFKLWEATPAFRGRLTGYSYQSAWKTRAGTHLLQLPGELPEHGAGALRPHVDPRRREVPCSPRAVRRHAPRRAALSEADDPQTPGYPPPLTRRRATNHPAPSTTIAAPATAPMPPHGVPPEDAVAAAGAGSSGSAGSTAIPPTFVAAVAVGVAVAVLGRRRRGRRAEAYVTVPGVP